MATLTQSPPTLRFTHSAGMSAPWYRLAQSNTGQSLISEWEIRRAWHGYSMSLATELESKAIRKFRARIGELKELRHGWFDGGGVPLPPDGLTWLADSFSEYYASDLPVPYLFPTPEGHAFAEWPLGRWAVSLEIDLVTKLGEWHALNLDNDNENSKSVDLTNPSDWQWLAGQLRNLGGAAE